MIIRRLQPGETALFKRLRLAALQDAPYAFSSSYADALQRSDQSWQQQAVSSAQGCDRATFILFCKDAPSGMAALYRCEDQTATGDLLQMWLSPEYRGTGLAQQLLESVLGWAQQNGFRRILAGVNEENARAVRFYTRCGFSPLEEAPTAKHGCVYLALDLPLE